MSEKSEPPEWTDDEKMAVLFGPFRDSREVNPSSWNKKMEFWNHFILQKYQLQGKAHFNGTELPSQFERRGKVPFCLGVVVQEMLKKGQLQRSSDFHSGAETSWTKWSYGVFVKKPAQLTYTWLLKKPTVWTFGKLTGWGATADTPLSGGAVNTQKLDNTDYVVIDVVKSLADRILETHYSSVTNSATDNVESLDSLLGKCRGFCGDEKSFDLALLWLCKAGRCLLQHTDQGKIVIFAAPNQQKVEKLSETDLQIYSLKTSEEKLLKQITFLEEEMEKCRQEAKFLLQRGMKSSAKNCLKKKKRLEAQQQKKEAAIDNIHHLLMNIQQAVSDKQVLEAYNAGVDAYKHLNQKYGLTPDAVDDVMVGVQEVLETQEELDRSISAPVTPDDDLEAELDAILDIGGGAKTPAHKPIPAQQPTPAHKPPTAHQGLIDSLCQMKLAEDDLPSVPTHDPNSPVSLSSSTPSKPSRVALLTSPGGVPTQGLPQSGISQAGIPQDEAPVSRRTWGSPVSGDTFAVTEQDSWASHHSGDSLGDTSWGLPSVPGDSPSGEGIPRSRLSRTSDDRRTKLNS